MWAWFPAWFTEYNNPNGVQPVQLLNNNINFDLSPVLDNFFLNSDDLPSPYVNVNISSLFYELPNLISKFKNTPNPIFLNINIQSLHSKYQPLKSFILELTNNKVPVYAVALQEIWNIQYLEDLKIPGFDLFVNQRKKYRGGGVGFYVKENLECKIVKNLTLMTEKIFESITIEIKINKQKFTLANYYRSPNHPTELTVSAAQEEFIELFHNFLSLVNESDSRSYIFSDSNINLLKLTHDKFAGTYFNTTLLNGFLNVTFKATRIHGISYGLIDHTLTNVISDNLLSGTILSDISDHFFTFVTDNSTTSKGGSDEYFLSRNLSAANVSNFKEQLRGLNWNLVTDCNDVDTSYNNFWNLFSEIFENTFPLRRVKRNRNIHKINNFMTQGLLVSRRTKNSLHLNVLNDPSDYNTTYYRTYRNLYNKLMRKSKQLYYESKLKVHSKNSKKTWDLIGEALNKQNSANVIPEIISNGKTLTDNVAKANAFNEFFTKIGKNINETIPHTKISFDSYLTRQHVAPPSLDLGNIGPIFISDVLKAMPNKSSPDLDGISLKILKSVRVEISTPLSHIFNLSLDKGVFPEALKCTRTVPVFKQGSKGSCDNYRPISLVKTFSKILEKIVALKLTNHLDINKLLYKHQYGFQRNKHTEHNLINLLSYVSSAINDGNYCMGIFLDIKKAFDCVPHDILFKKLEKLGIEGTSLKWFKSYLSGRSQKCDVNGALSDLGFIDIGVLQGSTLGPILFLCFINDLPSSNLMYSLLFADDTACLLSNKSLPELFATANTELHKIAIWFKANKLAVNVKKTKFIIFHQRQKKINLQGLKLYYNDNDPDEDIQDKKTELGQISLKNNKDDEKTYKYLGILLDEHLSFDQHVNYLCNKLSKSLYFISKVKKTLPRKALLTLYYSLFHSNLLYGLNVFSCTSAKNIDKIYKLQKRAVRTINLAKYNQPTSNLFLKDNILPFKDLILFKKACFMHTVYYGNSPLPLSDIFPKATQNHEHELRNINNFSIPRPKKDFFKKMPPFSFPELWNNLEEAKLYVNFTTFQIALKNRLLNNLSDPQ